MKEDLKQLLRAELPFVLSPAELATFWRVSRKSIYRLCERERLKGFNPVPKAKRIYRESIIDYMEAKGFEVSIQEAEKRIREIVNKAYEGTPDWAKRGA